MRGATTTCCAGGCVRAPRARRCLVLPVSRAPFLCVVLVETALARVVLSRARSFSCCFRDSARPPNGTPPSRRAAREHDTKQNQTKKMHRALRARAVGFVLLLLCVCVCVCMWSRAPPPNGTHHQPFTNGSPARRARAQLLEHARARGRARRRARRVVPLALGRGGGLVTWHGAQKGSCRLVTWHAAQKGSCRLVT